MQFFPVITCKMYDIMCCYAYTLVIIHLTIVMRVTCTEVSARILQLWINIILKGMKIISKVDIVPFMSHGDRLQWLLLLHNNIYTFRKITNKPTHWSHTQWYPPSDEMVNNNNHPMVKYWMLIYPPRAARFAFLLISLTILSTYTLCLKQRNENFTNENK